MTRYMDEHDQYLSTLVSGNSNPNGHGTRLAEEICRLSHDISDAHEDIDEGEQEEAETASKNELQRSEQQWNKMNSQNEGCKGKE